MKSILRDSFPHIIAVVTFLVLSYTFFFPVLQGEALPQHDITQYRGSAKEIVEHREEHGEEPLWTNSMFSGMPAYMISTIYSGNMLKKIDSFLQFNSRPASTIFLTFVGFYILLLAFGCSPWLSLVGALAYGFSSYFFIIIEAGHNAKMHAISYVAPMLAGVILAFKGRLLAGAAVFAFFLGLNIDAGHLQITYYAAFIVVAIGVAYLIDAIRSGNYLQLSKTVAVLLVGALLAVGANFSRMYFSWDYGKETIRGSSELTSREYNQTSGLDRDYATNWSYGKLETLNLLIPNLMGGASMTDLGTDSHTYEFLRDLGAPHAQARNVVQTLPAYWGPQPMTSGPVYVGAIVVFLFVLGAFLVKGRLKWALLAVTFLSILLAWGHNFNTLTNLFLDYFPLYNKFRTVSMILYIAEVTMPLLGILAVKNIMEGSVDRKELMHGFKWALGITGGICLLFILFGGALLSFSSPVDQRYIQAGYPAQMFDALAKDREAMMRTDAFRSLVFILLSAGAIWAYINKKIKPTYLLVALGVLVLADLWSVNRRYLNNDHFEPKARVLNPFTPTQANKQILADTTLYFRVFDMSRSAFNDASTSYFHSSIGGYHGAKLRRYQEVIEHHLSPPRDMTVLSMLNARYFIQPSDQGPVAQLNRNAMGNAWFVDSVKLVENADQEIAAIGDFNPASVAIVDERFKHFVEDYRPNPHPTDTIYLTNYRANRLDYSYSLQSPRLVVMSDIYYDKGWNAYVNGEPAEYFRVNYLLRAMVLPEGQNELTFEFRPRMFYAGYYIDLSFSLIILALLVGWIGYSFAVRLKKN